MEASAEKVVGRTEGKAPLGFALLRFTAPVLPIIPPLLKRRKRKAASDNEVVMAFSQVRPTPASNDAEDAPIAFRSASIAATMDCISYHAIDKKTSRQHSNLVENEPSTPVVLSTRFSSRLKRDKAQDAVVATMLFSPLLPWLANFSD
ncbi:hypothetical protein ACH5RR_009393 [Cinchona calisaya]|uniref:Uncharacterized protein n=1 Tax=Cinchona calisaya TaxID=153742 RepID=A0ABD3AE40_9GENT